MTPLIWLGILAAIAVIAVLLVKRRKDAATVPPLVDLAAHNLQIVVDENTDLLVAGHDRQHRYSWIDREKFLQSYAESWGRVRLNFTPLAFDNETLAFTPEERLKLKQQVILFAMHKYTNRLRPVRISRFWDIQTPLIRGLIMSAAEAKYGAKSEKAIALAAHTLDMSGRRFKSRRKRDEEYFNM
jgi:hypothetical protein